jgi:thioredoxin-related protein
LDRKVVIIVIVLGVIAVSAVSTLILLRVAKGGGCISQDNVFIVVYRYAKPLDNAYKSLAQIMTEALKTNSSGKFNIELQLCYVELNDLPPDLRAKVEQQFKFYPVFGLKSQTLSSVDIPIVNIVFNKYGEGIYIAKPNITWYLYLYLSQYYGFQYLDINGVYAMIITVEKPKIYINATPIIGSKEARYYIFVYEDVGCPYCAKLYYEVFPKILELVNNGTIAILLKNLLVHEEVFEVQRYLVALYIATRDNELIYDVMEFIYGLLLKGSQVTLNQVREYVINKYGRDVEIEKYLELAEGIINQEKEEAPRYIIIGTPGIIIWDNKNSIGIVVTGFKQAEDLIKLINFLNKI